MSFGPEIFSRLSSDTIGIGILRDNAARLPIDRSNKECVRHYGAGGELRFTVGGEAP